MSGARISFDACVRSPSTSRIKSDDIRTSVAAAPSQSEVRKPAVKTARPVAASIAARKKTPANHPRRDDHSSVGARRMANPSALPAASTKRDGATIGLSTCTIPTSSKTTATTSIVVPGGVRRQLGADVETGSKLRTGGKYVFTAPTPLAPDGAFTSESRDPCSNTWNHAECESARSPLREFSVVEQEKIVRDLPRHFANFRVSRNRGTGRKRLASSSCILRPIRSDLGKAARGLIVTAVTRPLHFIR